MAHGNWSIWKGIRMTVLAGTALTSAFVVAGPVAAYAEAAATLKSIDFTAQGVFNEHIDVVSTDNKTWNKIEPGNVKFGAHVSIDTRTYVFAHGWVEQAGIVLGACGGASCLGRPLLWGATPGTKDYEHQTTVTFSSGKIPVSSNGGIAAFADGDMIVKQCNSKLTPNSAPEHSFFHQMPATFVADTSVSMSAPADTNGIRTGDLPASWTHDPDHSATATFPVKINCKGFDVKRNVDDVAAEQPKELKVGSIELFRTTYSHANSQPNPGTVCKKARLLVRLETNKAGPVKFKLWTKIGDGPMASKAIDAWASRAANGIDTAEYAEWVEVAKTSYVQAMAEDMTNTFGQTSGWKDITLHCTGAGGGGLADAPRPNPDGPVTQPLKVTGELTLADQAGAPKDKPRLGQAVFKIWASKPGNTAYRLTCTGGRQWEGSLPTAKVGDKFQAVGAHNFQIDKTEQIGCALRSTSLPKHDVIAVASKLFELIKRNPDMSRPSDKLIVPSHPTHATPQRLVGQASKTPPAISCIGGLSTGTACFCKAPTVRVQTGPNAYRCVMDGMTTGRPTAPFARPAESRPQLLLGPARVPGAQPFARPVNRESSLPQRPFIR
jgi:hypothetical protein